jgi:hypothetical protein
VHSAIKRRPRFEFVLPVNIQLSKNLLLETAHNAFAVRFTTNSFAAFARFSERDRLKVVGLGRLELPTSPLSGVRSSHLSYRPKFFWTAHNTFAARSQPNHPPTLRRSGFELRSNFNMVELVGIEPATS